VAESCIDPAEAEVTINVIMAILRHVADRDDRAEPEDPVFYIEAGLNCRPFTDAVPGMDARISLDPTTTRDLVGRWLLASVGMGSTPVPELRLDSGRTLTVEDFLEGWTSLIPDSWARECDVHAAVAGVEGWEIGRNGEGREVLKMDSDEASHLSALQEQQVRAQTQMKGKWHEKFGVQGGSAAAKE